MKADNPEVSDVLRRSMVARIATLSRGGRPSINPLYFVSQHGHIWLGTVDWTLAARNIRADSRVTVLFAVERDSRDQRVLRISGRASVRTDQQTQRSYRLRAARKYILTPGGIRDTLAHWRQLALRWRYSAQSVEKGQSCVIEVIPEHVEFLKDKKLG